MRKIFIVLALLALPGLGRAAWGSRSCAPVGASAAAAPLPRFGWQWRPEQGNPNGWLLYDGAEQVGHYDWATGKFCWRMRGIWQPPSTPPWQASTTCPNYGVEVDKLNGGPRYLLNGREVSKATAHQVVSGGTLPDDRGKPRLTIIGTEADCRRVLQDLEQSPLKEEAVVKAYRPDHWAVRNVGFITSGRPTIYLQDAAGRVLHRQDDYRGTQDLEAIRKARPDYRPENDPDVRRVAPRWLEKIKHEVAAVPRWVWLVAGILLLLRFNRRGK